MSKKLKTPTQKENEAFEALFNEAVKRQKIELIWMSALFILFAIIASVSVFRGDALTTFLHYHDLTERQKKSIYERYEFLIDLYD